jgi:hypothetical protein
MCLDDVHGTLASEVEKMGGTPYTEVCPDCPLFETCKWALQHEDTAPGHVVKPHAYIHSYKSVKVGSKKAPHYLVVDESLFGTLLNIEEAKELPLHKLEPDRELLSAFVAEAREGNPTGKLFLEVDFIGFRYRLIEILKECEGPLVPAKPMIDLVSTRKPGTPLFDTRQPFLDMESEYQRYIKKRTEAVRGVKPQKTVHKDQIRELHELFVASLIATSILQLTEGCEIAPTRKTVLGLRVFGKKGKSERRVQALMRAPLPRILRLTPTDWLDGTADESIFRAMWGKDGICNLEVCRIEAKPVHYRLTHITDRSFARWMLAPDEIKPWQNPEGDDAEPRVLTEKERTELRQRKHRADSNLDCIFRAATFLSHLYTGQGDKGAVGAPAIDGLLIAQKKIRELIEEFVPKNLAMLNFGKLRGQDEYRGVRFIMVVGRAAPNYRTLELMCEAWH